MQRASRLLTLGSVQLAAGDAIDVGVSLEAAPAVLYDGLVLPDGAEPVSALGNQVAVLPGISCHA